MFYNLDLARNANGSYDVILHFDKNDAEFSMEFLKKENLKNFHEQIREFVQKKAKGISVRTVKFMVGSVVVATLLFSSLTPARAASTIYNMGYMYSGTASQQIGYVDRTQDMLNTVSPSYFDINADGSLKVNAISKTLVDSMHNQNIKVVPFLSNHWDRQAGINALKDVNKLADELALNIASYNLDGINVDIENVTHNERDKYTAFVAALRAKIPADKEVSVAVAANPSGWTTGWHGSYDYAALAKNSDYLMIMTYDEHFQGGDAGPVASISWVENSIKYALNKNVPKDKIVVGLPFFGRIWDDSGNFNGNGVSLEKVTSIINTYKATVTYDTGSQSPKAEFTVKQGDPVTSINGKDLKPGKYVVWYEDQKSLAKKVQLVDKYGLKGTGSWELGKEPASIWENNVVWTNASTAAAPSQEATYKITAQAANSSYGTVSGGGTFASGTSVTLLATPKAGYRFVRWLEGSTQVSEKYKYSFKAAKATTIKAEFAKIGTPAVTAAPAGYNAVKLSWGSVTGAAKYEVYRATTSGGTYSKVATVSSNSYTNTGLTTNKAYYYKVRAVCSATDTTYGGYSAVKSAKPVPAQITGVKAGRASSTSLKLSWAKQTGVTKYEVYRAASKDGKYTRITETASVSFTNTKLTKGKTYYYKVRGYRLVGKTKVYGAYSAAVSAKT